MIEILINNSSKIPKKEHLSHLQELLSIFQAPSLPYL
ncbi:MAG: hypothetical protein ACI9CQ_002915, partial [Saprospiraceae bacterium]